jgi:thiamine-monophosphate kinase
MPPDKLGEFDLIRRFFARSVPADRPDIALGVGDDCALLQPAAGEQWAVSTDTLVEGVHFLPGDPASLGHKALAVNLSDLAACGADPRCFFLALALPGVDPAWLGDFSRGLFALADAYRCVLAGGDTTRSSSGVVITVTVLGAVPAGQALLRSGASPGDDLWVSGTVGDAALGLALRQGRAKARPDAALLASDRLDRPAPRVALGQALRGLATSAIDVSDGLLGDLGHILERSAVGARVEWDRIPRSDTLRQQPEHGQLQWALQGGDDYELLFSAPAGRSDEVERTGHAVGVPVSRIGEVTSTGRLIVVDGGGRAMDTAPRAFDHFRP